MISTKNIVKENECKKIEYNINTTINISLYKFYIYIVKEKESKINNVIPKYT